MKATALRAGKAESVRCGAGLWRRQSTRLREVAQALHAFGRGASCWCADTAIWLRTWKMPIAAPGTNAPWASSAACSACAVDGAQLLCGCQAWSASIAS